MSSRRGKRYTVSYKEKPRPNQDPYAMLKAPKGPVVCRSCHAIYRGKRWYLNRVEAGELLASPTTRTMLCPACQKIRDDYPEGIVTLKWPNLRAHEIEIRNLIANVEERAMSINPLERVMKITRVGEDLEVLTTSDQLAQRLGRELVKAYKGRATTKWAHQDVLARVTWQGPEKKIQSKGKG